MKIKTTLLLILGLVSSAFGQSELAQAHLTIGPDGARIVTNALNLTIGIGLYPNAPFAPWPHDSLFENLYVQTTDVGHTFTVVPSDPDFANFAADLTDGKLNYCNYWTTMGSPSDYFVAGSNAGLVTEANFFSGLPPGNNGIDLGGFNITEFALRFDSLQLDSPGSNPGGGGVWTDYSLSAVFSVYGQAIPEPNALPLLGAMALAYGLVTRTRPNLTVQSSARPKVPLPTSMFNSSSVTA